MKTIATIIIFASLTSCGLISGSSKECKDSTAVTIDSAKSTPADTNIAPVDSAKVDTIK